MVKLTTCSIISIVHFEQVNAGCERNIDPGKPNTRRPKSNISKREKSLTFQPTLRLPNLTVLTMRDYSAGMKIRREQVIYNFPQLIF